jgi:pSer/pThr/pTyr-binding forkhead associated (FHA) protein
MPYLKLRNARSGEVFEFERDEVRIGRAPDLELPLEGEGSEVVSGNHARAAFRGGAWVLEDVGSTNGTFLDEQRLAVGQSVPIATGSVMRFGTAGPRFHVEAAAERKLVPTLVEGQPAVSPSDKTVQMDGLPEAPRKPTPPAAKDTGERKIRIVLREDRTGDVVTGEGVRLRIGRGRECELRPVQEGDTTVSRVHAEIALRADGAIVIRDANSRNGTSVNGDQLTAEYEIREGDYIVLGNEGPHLVVAELQGGRQVEPRLAAAVPDASGQPRGAGAKEKSPKPRRSFGGQGRTMFMRELVAETSKKSSATLRRVVWSFTFLLVGGVGGMYWYVDQQGRKTQAALEQQRQALAAQQAIADSIQVAAATEYDRLREDLDLARSSSAPAAVVDSLRQALVEAEARTEALAQSMGRAQTELDAQLARADSLRQIRESELERLRSQMTAAAQNSVSQELLDSLRQAVGNA